MQQPDQPEIVQQEGAGAAPVNEEMDQTNQMNEENKADRPVVGGKAPHM
jgi:hypothetical protein